MRGLALSFGDPVPKHGVFGDGLDKLRVKTFDGQKLKICPEEVLEPVALEDLFPGALRQVVQYQGVGYFSRKLINSQLVDWQLEDMFDALDIRLQIELHGSDLGIAEQEPAAGLHIRIKPSDRRAGVKTVDKEMGNRWVEESQDIVVRFGFEGD